MEVYCETCKSDLAAIVLALSLLSHPVFSENGLPRSITVPTQFGALEFDQIKIYTAVSDRPCGFSANIFSLSHVTWDDVSFLVRVTGVDQSGKTASFEFPVNTDYIGDNADRVVAACPDTSVGVAAQKLEISFKYGTPSAADVARYYEAEAAKRASVAAARARVARLAPLPRLDNGSSVAFVGSDLKCLVQYQDAARLDGIEKRKRIAELFSYGCGFLTTTPVKVEVLRTEGAYSIVKIAAGKDEGKGGWIPSAWIRPVTPTMPRPSSKKAGAVIL